MNSIRINNTFYIEYAAYVAGKDGAGNPVRSMIDLAEVSNLSVAFVNAYITEQIAPENRQVVDGKLRVFVAQDVQARIGAFRLLVKFDYQNHHYERDPLVVDLVQHVERERSCSQVEDLLPECTQGITDQIFAGRIVTTSGSGESARTRSFNLPVSAWNTSDKSAVISGLSIPDVNEVLFGVPTPSTLENVERIGSAVVYVKAVTATSVTLGCKQLPDGAIDVSLKY